MLMILNKHEKLRILHLVKEHNNWLINMIERSDKPAMIETLQSSLNIDKSIIEKIEASLEGDRRKMEDQ